MMANSRLTETLFRGNQRVSLFQIAFLITLSFPRVHGMTQETEEQLRKDLHENYNNDIRPPYNHSEPLDVYVNLFLRSISEVNVIKSTYSVFISVTFTWHDYRLSWNPRNYSGIQSITLGTARIWLPEIYLLYPAGEMSRLTMDEAIMWVYSNGSVTRGFLYNVKSTFQSNMTFFPTDIQICKIRLMADGFLSNEVKLRTNDTAASTMSIYLESKEWGIMNIATPTSIFLGRTEGIVEYELTLQRKNKYYVINMISPIVILALVHPLVFLVPPENGERVVFSVSMMLSYGIFMKEIRDRLPEVSDPMSYLSFYLMTSLIFGAIITTVTILNTRVYGQSPTKPVPAWLQLVVCVLSFRFLLGICACRRRRMKVQSIDQKSGFFQGNLPFDREWKFMARSLDAICFWYCIIALAVIFAHAHFMMPDIVS